MLQWLVGFPGTAYGHVLTGIYVSKTLPTKKILVIKSFKSLFYRIEEFLLILLVFLSGEFEGIVTVDNYISVSS